MYLNKAIIVGNLTRDPELRALPSGAKVCQFSIATNRVWTDKTGRQESVDFHNIVVFGNTAESSAQYLKKGSQVLVEGRLQTRSWDGQDGKKLYRTEIVADRVQFGMNRAKPGADAPAEPVVEYGDEKGEGARKTQRSASEGLSKPEKATTNGIEYPEEEIALKDIPF